ncbi:hypothetical protein SSBR45G_49870 [Bradyrhizobium sp. SSBR45G]|nr:hypothetical protein SSBR45G_49870 [Bradyrhizobium sp. SSBR45G]GLH87613.1 hypothetical protein SSBR45R_50730 [Bradyrhizobium sp. SSBR45R]
MLFDLQQFGAPGITAGAPLAVQPVQFFSIGAHGFGDDLRRKQPVPQPSKTRCSSSLRFSVLPFEQDPLLT